MFPASPSIRPAIFYLTAGGFKEVLRIRGRNLDPSRILASRKLSPPKPKAPTASASTKTATSLLQRRPQRREFIAPVRKAAEPTVLAQIPPHTRTLPDGKTEQALTANGIVFDPQGTTLYIADTARGAIWKLGHRRWPAPAQPALMTQSPLLEGADGPAFDPHGNLWVAANERNAVVMVEPDGTAYRHHKKRQQRTARISHLGGVCQRHRLCQQLRHAAARQSRRRRQDFHRRHRRFDRQNRTVRVQ